MKEIRITIINDGSNNVKEFKGEAMLREAAIYLSKLAGLILFEKTSEPAINIDNKNTQTEDTIVHQPTEQEIKDNNLEGIVEPGDKIEIPNKKSVLGKIKDALK
ncbi:hypothetical protein [Methanoculleus sp.]|jgi:hypothetical protein|uniref:hypothetical protein n=1 Tax=Methanoculleus sp. TaxID=90427 RepID=UPI0025F64D21|nr:hypothetical protein [Methanoculleus sp.]MCK9320268.1 hypothetical protein [Methanoculleus sp.]